MNLTSFQAPEIRDSNDNIIQAGAYGKNTAFCNGQNTGILDYINNNLLALQNDKMSSVNAYSKTQVDSLLNTKADASEVYTKVETNTLLNDKADSSDLNNYLLLSGGTLKGDVFTSHNIAKNTNNGELDIFGGNGWDNGAVLCLRGKNNSYEAGSFELGAYDDNGNHTSLFGSPNGRLYWGSKDVSCIDSLGTNHIRFTNGVQICWGETSFQGLNAGTDRGEFATFQAPFKDSTYIISLGNRSQGENWTKVMCTVTSKYNSNAWVSMYNDGSGNCPQTACCWQAIGYWK